MRSKKKKLEKKINNEKEYEIKTRYNNLQLFGPDNNYIIKNVHVAIVPPLNT